MRSKEPRRIACCAAAASLLVALLCGTARPADEAHFARRVQPFLAKYCYDCHSGAEAEAGLALDALGDAAAVREKRAAWGRVVEFLEAGLMPPADQQQPTPDEVAEVTACVSEQLAQLGGRGGRDPGRVTIRRLNRAEYNNTVRDLVGVDFQPADDFPSDDVGYGFDNIGDVLSMPPILMEKYLAAAEKIASRAIVTAAPTKPLVTRLTAGQLKSTLDNAAGATSGVLHSTGELYAPFEFATGEYLIRAQAYGEQAGPEIVRMALRVDGQDAHTVEVAATAGKPQVYEARVRVESGRRRVAAAFLNDYYRPDDPDPAQRDRNLVVDYLEVEGPCDAPHAKPASHGQIIFRDPKSGDEEACARDILGRLASRAYRRPATADETERLLRFVRLAREHGESFEAGIQLALEAVLVSPHFLFRVELDGAGDAPAQPIGDHQLAARLSYFLWSSMPDDELARLADAGTLRQRDTLAAQVKRMLADPKSQALVENFAGQWLQLRNLSLAAPNRKQFKQFDDGLRAAMLRETELFCAAVMREDRSVLDLLDADYTFVNEPLARLYGIDGVTGDEFRRVTLSDRRRGGVLTQASVLLITSNPTRTSPVKRGKWIMEQILGTPPPPPPPGVPELEQVTLAGSLREKMEQHRANPACATCHARMDPLGFAFENFDPIGAWREREGDLAIDASGTLPGGQSFAGPAELRAILKSQPQRFARSLAKKMLTYALGRGLEPADHHAVGQIAGQLAAEQYRFGALVLAIVESEPFQLRRGRGVEP